MRLQEKILHLKDRKQDGPSKQEDEECYQKKRKEQKYEQLSYNTYDEQGSRGYSSHALDGACECPDRHI